MGLNTFIEIKSFRFNAPRFNPTPVIVVGTAFVVRAYHEVNSKKINVQALNRQKCNNRLHKRRQLSSFC